MMMKNLAKVSALIQRFMGLKITPTPIRHRIIMPYNHHFLRVSGTSRQ